jgi:hypothetical protein
MALHPSDKPAAFAGLIGGAILIAVLCYAMVLWTNARFEGHTPGRPAPAGAPAGH